MSLHTKSVQKPTLRNDGIRICIMRRPEKNIKFHIWLPILAPSNKLLTDYHNKKYSWFQFEKVFKRQVLKKQKRFINLLCEIAVKQKVTILCWENEPTQCHRILIAEACKIVQPKLKVIIK